MDYFDILLTKKLEDDRDPKVEGLSVNANGRYHEDGVVYDPVIVNVPETPLSKLTVTENGTYTAPSGTAYNEVEVDVPLPENAYLLKSVSGLPQPIATFSDGANLPMPKLEVGIEPIQEGSGDPSPTNIRPISGWDEVNVVDDAVYGGFIDWNQLVQNVESWANQNTDSRTTFQLYCNGSLVGNISSVGLYQKILHRTSSASLINIKHNGSTQDLNIYNDTSRGLIKNHNYLISLYVLGTDPTTVGGMSLKNLMLIDLTQVFGSTKADEIYAMEQAEAGSGVAYFKSLFYKDYYPYNSGEITNVSAVNGDTDKYSTYTIPFLDSQGNPITVYGGELDVVSGVLTVDKGYIASYNGETLPSTWISDRDVYVEGTSPTTGAQVVYELTTPLTIQLTPTMVKSLRGMNNVYADSGDILDLSYFGKEE